ncbi:hypothetical protein FJ955_03890 [Mesorhizobium sp. B2-2-2]|uniref:hypothetical protein n=1 Tax=Mesorhizobium sp. B2-2-2 TaxID=2589964 RepID=UPI00112833CD|nr:hypothetical protein [Mesorhizobium sp. B2-2-2]TPM33885.1 hypothetical protein FJ955_03890 [Mesorhizobium sp. B2-2-2]
MSNELTVPQNSGAVAEPATSDLPGGVEQGGFASLPANSARKAEIEAIMRSDFARYEDEGLDKEYRALLQAEIEAVNPDAGTPTAPTPADNARTLLCSSQAGQKLVYEWERMGGFRTHLANVQKDIGAIVRDLGNNRVQRVFLERFNRSVPVAAEVALIDEIASGALGYVAQATQGEIDLFKTTPAGKLLAQEWGTYVPEKVATLRARAARMTERMDEDDAADFWDWFSELETPVIMKIYRRMAG